MTLLSLPWSLEPTPWLTGSNYWWGGEPKYNRTQWSLINTNKPDEIITMPTGNGGNKNPNDCLPTTLSEIEQVRGGSRTYEFFLKELGNRYTPEGVATKVAEYEEMLNKYFMAVKIDGKLYNIFDPNFMKGISNSNGVVSVYFGGELGHVDNVRKLKVFYNAPNLNKLIFRNPRYNINQMNFRVNDDIKGVFVVY